MRDIRNSREVKRSPKSRKLCELMISIGYPEPFAEEISRMLNTDFTAEQMIGYLSHLQTPRLEDVVDEALAIIALRDRLMEKKLNEAANARWNEWLNEEHSE